MVELKNNKLIVNGIEIKGYREGSHAKKIVQFLISNKAFTREYAMSWCAYEEIPETSFNAELSMVNKVTEQKLGFPLFVSTGIRNPEYRLHEKFNDGAIMVKLYIPLTEWVKFEDELEKYRIKEL